MNQRKPDALDIAVGRRIRIERLAQRMPQAELAQRIGVSFQQLQKYERGQNRVGAGRLSRIAQVLGIPVPSLFETEWPTKPGRRIPRTRGRAAESAVALLGHPGAIRALQAFAAISPRLHPPLLTFMEKLATSQIARRARDR